MRPRAPTASETNQLLALNNARRFPELEARARLLLEQYPEFGPAWKLLGRALRMQAKNPLQVYRSAAELMPADAEIQFGLADALQRCGLSGDAVASYRKALALKPDFVEAQSGLGAALYELGHYVDALASFRRATELAPGQAASHYNLGTILSELGRPAEAVASYRRALRIQPDYAMAYYNLGNALRCLGDAEQAAANFRRSLEIDPGFPAAHINLGVILQEQERFAEAEACYRNALRINPGIAEGHSNLGHVLRRVGHFREAMACYTRAMELDPRCQDAMRGAAQLYLENGQKDEAEQLLKKALAVDARDAEARYLASQIHKAQPGDENLSAMEEMAEAMQRGELTLSNDQAIFLHFGLGKALDDIGDHTRAFPHFMQGCKLKRAVVAYDPDRNTRHVDAIIRAFSAETMRRLGGGGDPSAVPVFVLGMPRSGTTLTEQIIASHPDVHGAGELPDMLSIAQRDPTGTGLAYPDNVLGLDRSVLAQWGKDYVARLRALGPDALRITDKMPANFLVAGLIHLMLPNARIIHVNRNPMDTCVSCFTQLFRGKQPHTYDLAELGRYYVDYDRLMSHWRHVLPAERFLDVQYEDLVEDLETEARRLIGFCGLQWSDACIEFHSNKNAVRTASLIQVRQPIYQSSVERWRSYEEFLGPLLAALGDLAKGQRAKEMHGGARQTS